MTKFVCFFSSKAVFINFSSWKFMITNSFRQGFVEKPVFANLMKQFCVPFDPSFFSLSCFLTLALLQRKFCCGGTLNIIDFEAIGHLSPQPKKSINHHKT